MVFLIGAVCGIVVGAISMTMFNHARWAIFPLSGGPIGINRWLGGPPEPHGETYMIAVDKNDDEGA